jgi:hypothetical protein
MEVHVRVLAAHADATAFVPRVSSLAPCLVAGHGSGLRRDCERPDAAVRVRASSPLEDSRTTLGLKSLQNLTGATKWLHGITIRGSGWHRPGPGNPGDGGNTFLP